VKEYWNRLADRLDALALRERVLVFGATVMVIIGVLYTFFIDVEVRRQKQLASDIVQKQSEAAMLAAQLTQLAKGRASDPDKPQRERLEQLRAQVAEVDRQIASEERKFTTPEHMKQLVEEMLARNRGVQLVALRTLGSTSLAEARAAGAARPAAAPSGSGERLIHRFGIEVTVAGTYLDLYRYLSELERLPSQLYWSSLELDASNYPVHNLKFVVYTLSLDPAWMKL
jgi:MSHA biogenesis protein MshJ